jgi:hypothetical protein
MAQMNRMKSNLQSIESVISNLEAGQLMQQELEMLVELTRDLYEISLILRHKAYEEQVFGATPVSNKVPLNSDDNQTEASNDETSHSVKQMDSEKNQLENSEFEMEQSQPSFEFNLFDDPVQPVENSFDKQLLEEPTVPFFESVETITSVAQEDFDNHEFNTEIELEEITDFPELETNDAFMNRYSVVDSQLTNQLGMSRLETLIGSFGLNERLQYINELFDGSSEALSNAVKVLDNASNYSDALQKIAQLADQYQWDLSSETVEEFMVKIQRRHV